MTEFLINTGVFENLSKIINKYAIGKRVVIIRGMHSYPKAVIDPILQKYDCQSVDYIDGFSSNPKIKEIEEGLERVKELNPDVFIGVGGGSIMDITKILCYFSKLECSADQRAKIIQGNDLDLPYSKKPVLILIPTTAGSGAEATAFSVVYFGDHKFSFLHPRLIADYSIADYKLIKDAPQNVLASSAMDAIAQSIESFWALGGTDTSRCLALEGIGLMWKSTIIAVKDRSPNALADIVLGSNYIGRAINISKTTGNHALSYKITTDHGIPHGHCVGMLLPKFFELHQRIGKTDPDRAKVVIAAQKQIATHLGFDEFKDFQTGYDNMLNDLNLKSFNDLNKLFNFNGADIAASVNIHRLGNHPVELNFNDLQSIF